jgi:hypothetical protein
MMVLMCVVSVMCFHFDINDGAISNIVHERLISKSAA